VWMQIFGRLAVTVVAVCVTGVRPMAVPAPGAPTGSVGTCNVTLDPPQVVRWGDDLLSSPLAPTGTLDDCEALCCASATCVAFSFNNPQPNNTCVGGTCCTQGGVCCMLKGVPGGTPRPNPYPGAVQTGGVSQGAGPGPTPPFAPSTLVTGVEWCVSTANWGPPAVLCTGWGGLGWDGCRCREPSVWLTEGGRCAHPLAHAGPPVVRDSCL
jgi:hypothetical protein